MSEQTPYDRVYSLGKEAERQRILDAVKELKTFDDQLTHEIVFVQDLEEAINGE